MFKKFQQIESTFSIQKAAFIVGFFALLSRATGLVRDLLLTRHFGAGNILDVYNAAFRIPDFIFNLLILGTLSAAFIPVFTQALQKDKDEANRVANSVLNISIIGMAIICLIAYSFVGFFTKLVVPGFTADKLTQTISLTRLFLLSPIIFTISNVFTSILQSKKKFLIVSIAPILYNLGIILGLFLLYPQFGLFGLGLGVIAGALMHMLFQIPETIRQGFRWQFIFNFRDSAIKKIGKLFVPRIIGVDMSNISLLIGTIIGSTLVVGSVTIFTISNNLQSVPLGIFAFSSAVAVFPLLSEHFAKNDEEHFLSTLNKTIVQILFFIIPLSLLMMLHREYVVRLVFGYGKFNWSNTILTFQTFGVLSFSLFSQALAPLLSRAFYARQNTIIPVLVNLFSICLNAILGYLLAHLVFYGKVLGIIGVAAGFSLASIVNISLLFLILHRKLESSPNLTDKNLMSGFDKSLFQSISKIILASLAMGMASYGMQNILGIFINTHKVLGLLTLLILTVLPGIIVFFVIASKLNLSEAKFILKTFKKLLLTKLTLNNNNQQI